jgi:small multidrug resistance pump
MSRRWGGTCIAVKLYEVADSSPCHRRQCASASALVKMAMTPPRKFPPLAEPMAALANWPLWLGLALCGAAFLLYAATLVTLPLNVAYPVLVFGSVVAIALMSMFLFREPFYWTTIAGIAMVIGGVVLIAMHAT